MSEKYGIDAKVYYGTAGETPTTELTIVREVTLDLEKAEADLTTRGGGGWKATGGKLKDATVSIEVLHDTEDAGYQALRDAFLEDSAIALKILDAEDGEGLDADWTVTKMGRPEPTDDAIKITFDVKPTVGRTPAWIEPATS